MLKQHSLAAPAALIILAALLAAIPTPAEDSGTGPRPYADSAHAANIDAAIGFLLKDRGFGRWMNLVMLDYLQRKFGLGEQCRHANTFGPPHPTKGDLSLVESLNRLVDPDHQYTPPPLPEDPGLYDFMAHTLYCDRIPVSADFHERLRGQIAKHRGKGGMGDYLTAYNAIACQWMIENGCAGDDYEAFHNELGDALVDIVMRNGRDKDIGFTAMALLYYMGFGDRIPRVWLDQMVDAQQPDGGWKLSPEKKLSDGHPTVMALWVLLEAALPDAPDVPWIPKAGPAPAGK
ncbi:MAG: hypothetical protein GX580_17160 [Candidatus Hydrogenedens sp.]|nr:hypothetical protein [Candidatus Hydrogenedentota bacterium]NLF59357.1 hypothetical protein [Candidatus Hydrogenedens sp.]